jgi:hypothetical protein
MVFSGAVSTGAVWLGVISLLIVAVVHVASGFVASVSDVVQFKESGQFSRSLMVCLGVYSGRLSQLRTRRPRAVLRGPYTDNIVPTCLKDADKMAKMKEIPNIWV